MDQANGKRYFKVLQNKLNPQQEKGKEQANHKQIAQCPDSGL